MGVGLKVWGRCGYYTFHYMWRAANGYARMRVQIVSKCRVKRWGRHVRDGLEVLGFHDTCLAVIGLLGRWVQKFLIGF